MNQRWSFLAIGLLLTTAFVGGAACRDDELPRCFDGSLKPRDRIAMRIIERVDEPAPGVDAGALLCAPSVGVNVGDTLFATITDERESNRCVGFAARLEAPAGLPSDLFAHSLGDGSGNEIVGSEEFQSSCEGGISQDIRFEADKLPITIPAMSSSPRPPIAWINFYYSARPADGSPADSCTPSCATSLHVSVEVVVGQDAR